jgi:[lysine-biosynthesis-protein LysW]---L-2-aminoadipate ligase
MRVAVVGWESQETNPALVRAWRDVGIEALAVTPPDALSTLEAGDVAIGRIDVLPTLDGVEDGLYVLDVLAQRGVRVLNSATALLAAHDKLETAELFRRAHLPHPRTAHLRFEHEGVSLAPPLVIKPRFGSWGKDVFVCRDPQDVRTCLDHVWTRRWFRRHGALVQDLVPPRLYDLRLIVAGGRVVGAGRRHAAAGEWRTNISLGGSLSPEAPEAGARALGVAAAAAVGMDLVGVDLLPVGDGSFVVLEVNGAVDFDGRYSLPGGDVYLDVAAGLHLDGASIDCDVRDLSA